MKILAATALTQGTSPDDYHYCVEGELVWIQEPCDRDKNNPTDRAAADEGSPVRRHIEQQRQP
jgi:hypothetical protein